MPSRNSLKLKICEEFEILNEQICLSVLDARKYSPSWRPLSLQRSIRFYNDDDALAANHDAQQFTQFVLIKDGNAKYQAHDDAFNIFLMLSFVDHFILVFIKI